jgi:DNA recombination protein RmuC
MSEPLLTGVIVFLAVLLAAGVLVIIRPLIRGGAKVEGPEARANEIDALKNETARQKAELATLEADLKHAVRQLENKSEEVRESKEKVVKITAERDELDRRVVRGEEAAKAFQERLKDLNEAKDRMRQEFKEIAGELMKNHGETFTKQNKQQIDQLLNPLKTKIEEFEKGLTTSHKENLTQRAALKEQIEGLSKRSIDMSNETRNLTRALKGEVQMQGAWGEMILETILQRSGLREGEEYTRQDSHTDENGQRVRTDIIVNLPNGEHIIIDAKVSLKDFEGFVNADDDDERSTRLAAHAVSVKNHIKILAGKEYHARAGSKLDFVIMFIPIEAALGAALQQDGEIGFAAADKKVAIATPTTLTIALKTVAAIWRVERQNQNAAEIAKRAGKLYDKFAGFLKDIDKIGERLGQLQGAYEGARAKLTTGSGNLVRQVEMLKAMGAETNKVIPPEYLDDDPPLENLFHESAGETVKAIEATKKTPPN